MSKIYLRMKKNIINNKVLFRVLKGFQMLIFGNRREYIILDEKKLVYLMNPKVANSSIKATFLDEDIEDNGQVHRKMKKSKRALDENEKEYYIFTFVRNPYDRLVSCYENKYHINRKSKESIFKRKLWFDNYLFGYMKKDSGFEAFVDKVVKIPDRLADRHFRSQYDLIYGKKNKVQFDFIGHFENINEEYDCIIDKFGVKKLPHLNSSKKKDYKTYYTKETAKKVYHRFKKDFETFAYTSAYDDLMNWLATEKNRTIRY